MLQGDQGALAAQHEHTQLDTVGKHCFVAQTDMHKANSPALGPSGHVTFVVLGSLDEPCPQHVNMSTAHLLLHCFTFGLQSIAAASEATICHLHNELHMQQLLVS